MRFYYLVAYSPSNENYDGRFRTVSVKVTRPGVQVQTRQGYFAIRADDAVGTLEDVRSPRPGPARPLAAPQRLSRSRPSA